jgi:hypothetical protein
VVGVDRDQLAGQSAHAVGRWAHGRTALGLLAFFTIVWPNDPQRLLLRDGGVDAWFLIHAAQAILFTALAVMAFKRIGSRRYRIR